MLVHRYCRNWRRKSTRQLRLEFLGRVLALLSRRVPIGYEADEFGESVLTAASARRVQKIAQVRRIVARLANFAAASPYSAEEPEERFGHHERLDEEYPAPEAQQPLWWIVERILEELPPADARMLEWRYGVNGQKRMPVSQIAHRLKCTERTVWNTLDRIRREIASRMLLEAGELVTQ